ncbi:20374_t:CDS:2 [Entrophospora sp. SA101]|nr:20374_t:CDS:2 [Entrophospora sp. SA101]
MSQAWEPQTHPKPKIFPELNEFLNLFFVELKTTFLKFCLFGAYFIGTIVYLTPNSPGLEPEEDEDNEEGHESYPVKALIDSSLVKA